MSIQQITKRLYNWASILEENTLEQAKRTSEMPFIHPHLALMPDLSDERGSRTAAEVSRLTKVGG